MIKNKKAKKIWGDLEKITGTNNKLFEASVEKEDNDNIKKSLAT